MEPESWAASSELSPSGASGEGVVSIVSLLAMILMLPFENISVSIFSPDDKKWSSGEMVETTAVAVAAGATEAKNMASIVASWSRVEVWLVASFAALLFILLILCFSVQVFFINVFSFKRLINLKRLFLEDKENKVTRW